MCVLALPEPKYKPAVKGIPETDELEEEVKPKPAELADAPKPPPKKSRQPVRITIPALNPVGLIIFCSILEIFLVHVFSSLVGLVTHCKTENFFPHFDIMHMTFCCRILMMKNPPINMLKQVTVVR